MKNNEILNVSPIYKGHEYPIRVTLHDIKRAVELMGVPDDTTIREKKFNREALESLLDDLRTSENYTWNWGGPPEYRQDLYSILITQNVWDDVADEEANIGFDERSLLCKDWALNIDNGSTYEGDEEKEEREKFENELYDAGLEQIQQIKLELENTLEDSLRWIVWVYNRYEKAQNHQEEESHTLTIYLVE